MQMKNAPSYIRVGIVGIAVILLFSAIIVQLLNLQVRSGEVNQAQAEGIKMKTITLTGTRGKITDRNGLVLAYDTPSYDLEFYRETSGTQARHGYTQVLLKTIDIVEANKGKLVDNFSIVRDERGIYAFDFKTTRDDVAQRRREMWLSNFGFDLTKDAEITAEQAYERLLINYGIEGLEWERAHKVLALWEEWLNNAFLAKPVRIARDVDMTTVAQVEARQVELQGVSVRQSTTRVYPRGETAAHTLGYMGAISGDRYEEYVSGKKYAPDELIGVSGIELFMEDELTGASSIRQGVQTVEVNASNRVTRELSFTPATDGNNVVLTIDLPLQIILEQALKETIAGAQANQLQSINEATETKRAVYLNAMLNREATSLNMAQTGAAVVMEVDTGKVLAAASYPSFDPNDFVGGLSVGNYQKYYDTDKSELAKLSPTLNRVIRTKATPGSIFKMVTALAGVMEGVVGIDTRIDDDGPFTKYTITGKSPQCWVWPNFHLHNGMTVSTAISNSCNYYFYTVADGLGIDRLNEWAGRLGLTSTTGVELSGEVASVVGKQEILYDVNKTPGQQTVARTRQAVNAVRSQLRNLRDNLERNYTDERIEDVLTQLMQLVVQSDISLNASIRDILMTELGLSYQEVAPLVGNIQAQIADLRWTPTETIMTGIGQSITEVTPIGVARYISALANGGTVYDAQLIDRIVAPDGTLVREIEPVSAPKLEGVGAALEAIKQGMKGVVDAEEGGTAAKYFKDYPYTDQIAGKTGTAQVNLIDIEDNAWFVAYAPIDDPKIAVVVFIGNGMSGGYCSPTAQAVFTHYFESQERVHTDPEPVQGQWIP